LRRWKLTDEDWRNRDKRGLYEDAVDEMLRRTDDPDAPWTVIPGDHKPTARALVLERVCDALETALGVH
jgi:polyphosphate kinase 2 (PPK2 family)